MITDWPHRNRAQIRLAVRIATACLIAYFVGQLLQLEQSQWAVLTSVIVMQASVGASLKAMMDRFIGSLGGAIVGVLISVGLHHAGIISPGLVLAVGVPPLALLAAMKPSYRVTPITFIILVLTPDLQELGPLESAYQRMLEIGVGSVIALGVSLLILPARAHESLVQVTSQALVAMADLMTALPSGITGQPDPETIQAAHERIRIFIGKAEIAADEALRERASYLTDAADPLPICRTLRRLRHDLAILGRTMAIPLPDTVSSTMNGPILSVSSAIAKYLGSSAEAFANRGAPPPLTELDMAFAAQSSAVTAIRQQGLTRTLPDDDLVRIFGLGFALEQLRHDLQDLADRGAELARDNG